MLVAEWLKCPMTDTTPSKWPEKLYLVVLQWVVKVGQMSNVWHFKLPTFGLILHHLRTFTSFIFSVGPYGALHHLWTCFPYFWGLFTFNCFIQHHGNRLHLGSLLLRNWEFFYTSQNYFLSTFFTIPGMQVLTLVLIRKEGNGAFLKFAGTLLIERFS